MAIAETTKFQPWLTRRADVIMEYCFARSYNRLAAPDFDPSYKHASHRGVRLAQIAKHIRPLGWLVTALLALPESILVRCGPSFEMFLTERKVRFPLPPLYAPPATNPYAIVNSVSIARSRS